MFATYDRGNVHKDIYVNNRGDNWSFDQNSTITIGSSADSINIDNNINSGRDLGASFIDDSAEDPGLDSNESCLKGTTFI